MGDLTDARYREIVYRLLVIFWFTMPWEGVIRVGGSATLAKAVGAVVFIAALGAFVRSGIHTRPNDYIFVLLTLTCWAALSLFWTVTPDASRSRIITFAQLTIMALLTWEFGHNRRRVRGLMAGWLAGCAVLGALIIYAAAGGGEKRYFAAGTHPGDQAYALLVGIPMAWYLAFQCPRPSLATLYRLFVPFACFAAVLTASRAALVSMLFALIIVPLTLSRLSSRERVAVGVTTLTAAAAAIAFITADSDVVQRLGTTSSEISSGTLDHRTTIWSIALRLVAEHPLVGTGLGGSQFAISGQFSQGRVLHNTYLSFTFELGLIGLALFLLTILTACYRALTSLSWLETRFAWSLLMIFAISLFPRTDTFSKSTFAILTLFALMGSTFPRTAGARVTGRTTVAHV